MSEMPHPPRPQRNYVKIGLFALGVGMMLFAGIAALVLIVTPIAFRNLSEADQARVVRRIPIMRVFMPTPEGGADTVLPTVVVTSDAALALLNTAAPPTAIAIQPTQVPPTAIPASATFTDVPPTELPTSTAIPPSATTAPTDTPAPTETSIPSETPLPPTTAAAIVPTDAPATAAQIAQVATTLPPPTAVPSATETPAPKVITATPLPPLPTNTDIPPTATPLPPTETPLPTSTPLPSATFTPAPPTLVATPTDIPAPPAFSLIGKVAWEPQLWNNCGPANLLQVMRYLKWRDNQANIASFLKPNANDKNVSPEELVNYVNSKTTLRALTRSAGSLGLLKALISQGFGVIIETGYIDPEEVDKGWLGHYMTLIGYDDNSQLITWMDTLHDVQTDSYATQYEYWRHFNRVYVIVYDPAREAELMSLLGPNADPAYNALQSLDLAKAEASMNPSDPYAWFNMGTSFAVLKRYQEAATAYDQAFSLGVLPYRHTWYQFGFYEAYYQTGQYQRVLDLADYNIEKTKGDEEEPFYWRGMVFAATGRSQEAVAEFQAALKFNKYFMKAGEAMAAVRNGTFQAPILTPRG
ncbi:MAG: C39 family peptidase [Anaerolineae bacterium]|nr:C39 family peptidase [Anaerolineae bacterium]